MPFTEEQVFYCPFCLFLQEELLQSTEREKQIVVQQLESSEREKQTVRQQLQSRNQVRNTISVVHPK